MNFKIKWTKKLHDIYNYGSTITYSKDNQVIFENELFPPGTTVVKWVSNSYYQKERTLVQLPLLKRGTKYHIKSDFQSFPADSLFIRLIFFDRLGKKVGMEVFPDNGGEFVYKDEAFSYTIELVNMGLEKLIFNYLNLSS